MCAGGWPGVAGVGAACERSRRMVRVTARPPAGQVESEAAGRPESHADAERLSRRVGHAVAWGGANQLLIRLINIAVMMVVARLVAPREFGVFAVAITVHAIVSNIGELGVSSCLMRGDMEPDEIAPTVATVSLVSSGVLATLMFLFADTLSTALGSAQAAQPMRVMALAVLLVGVFAVPSALLVRDFRQDKLLLATAVSAVPANLSLVLLALHGGGAMAFAWSRVIGQLVMGAVVWRAAARHYVPGFTRRTASQLLHFGLPLAGANLVNYTVLNADYAVVGHSLGPVQLGIYLLAFNVASWSTSLMGAVINSVVMPAFSRLRHDPGAFAGALATGVGTVALVAMPFAAVSAVMAGPLVVTMYGARWESAAPVLTLLAPYGAFSVLCLLLANVLVGLSRTRVVLWVQAVWLAALVPAMLVGVSVGGVRGAATAHIVVILGVVFPTYLVVLSRAVGAGTPVLVLKALALPSLGSLVAAAAGASAARLAHDPAEKLLLGAGAAALAYLLVLAPVLQQQLERVVPAPRRQSFVLARYARLARSMEWLAVSRQGTAPEHPPATVPVQSAQEAQSARAGGGTGVMRGEAL
ncbi:MAG: lipopolysaccharide biosynthesis protein [Mycobacteriales bacterium]